MRFAAALLIALYHYGDNAPVQLEKVSDVFQRGYLATNFFLILSGFVLGRAYGRRVLGEKLGLAAFFRKRLERIWPAQLVVLAALAALYFGARLAGAMPQHPEHYSALAFAMQAFLLHGLGIPGGKGWNRPSWSLSALLVCYAGFPFIWRALSRVRSPLSLVALGLNVLVAGDLLCVLVLRHHLYDLSIGVLRAVPLFFLGVCLARVVELGQPSVRAARWLAGASVVVLVGLQLLGRYDLPSTVCIAAIVLAFGRLPVMRPSALIERAAKLSFALFITHAATGFAWWGALAVVRRHVTLSTPLAWALWACSIPVALVVAAAFERLVDEPIQRWLAKRRERAATQVGTAPTALQTDLLGP